jgi:hypothetical protein
VPCCCALAGLPPRCRCSGWQSRSPRRNRAPHSAWREPGGKSMARRRRKRCSSTPASCGAFPITRFPIRLGRRRRSGHEPSLVLRSPEATQQLVHLTLQDPLQGLAQQVLRQVPLLGHPPFDPDDGRGTLVWNGHGRELGWLRFGLVNQPHTMTTPCGSTRRGFAHNAGQYPPLSTIAADGSRGKR